MDPKTRYQQERNESKQQRLLHILTAAETVFILKGIEKTTMQDVAKEANIGIATLFRYFPKKDKMIVAVAAKRIEPIHEAFRSIASTPGTCLEKIERLLDFFIAQLQQPDQASIKFMEDFESYAAHSPEPLADIENFNALYRTISLEFQTIIEDGISDGSIRSDLPIPETLSTVVNVFGLFSRKLSLHNNILTFVSDFTSDQQLAVLKRIVLDYLRG